MSSKAQRRKQTVLKHSLRGLNADEIAKQLKVSTATIFNELAS